MAAPHPEDFVRWFRQVAPYVHDFGGRTFVVAFGGEMVAERARFASFIHDVNVLAVARDPAGAGARRAAADRGRAEARRACARSYAQGLRITDERALHRGQARRRRAARRDRGAALAGPARTRPMARAQIRVVSGQLHHRAADRRAQGRRLPVHRRGAQGGRGRASRATSTSATSCWCRTLGYSTTGEVFNLAWEDVAENVARRAQGRQAAHVHRQAAGGPQGQTISELTADEAAALSGKKGRPHARRDAAPSSTLRAGGRGRRAPRPPRDAPRRGLAPAGALHPRRRRHHGHRRRAGEAAGRRRSRTCAACSR